MKLISEEIQNAEYLVEETNGKKSRTRLRVSFYNQISKIEMEEYMKMISYKRSR